jgi:hypothetical protein
MNDLIFYDNCLYIIMAYIALVKEMCVTCLPSEVKDIVSEYADHVVQRTRCRKKMLNKCIQHRGTKVADWTYVQQRVADGNVCFMLDIILKTPDIKMILNEYTYKLFVGHTNIEHALVNRMMMIANRFNMSLM